MLVKFHDLYSGVFSALNFLRFATFASQMDFESYIPHDANVYAIQKLLRLSINSFKNSVKISHLSCTFLMNISPVIVYPYIMAVEKLKLEIIFETPAIKLICNKRYLVRQLNGVLSWM